MNTGTVSLPMLAANTSESVSAPIFTPAVGPSNEAVATNVSSTLKAPANASSEGKINDLIDEIDSENKLIAVKSTNVATKNVSTVADKHHGVRSKEKLSSVISTKFKEYKVKSGDTLYSISKKFRVGIDEIKHDNKLDGNTVNLHQILRIR